METQPHEYQTEIYRKMTPQQKYDVMTALNETARKMKEAYLRSVHTDWSDEQIRTAIKEWRLYARQ